MIRRLWYATLGALAVYAWRRIADAERAAPSPGEPMVTVTVAAPARLYPPMVAGFGCEVQAVLMSDLQPPPRGGIDDATGLPWDGTPGDDMPGDEE